jgi:hypothetical protein
MIDPGGVNLVKPILDRKGIHPLYIAGVAAQLQQAVNHFWEGYRRVRFKMTRNPFYPSEMHAIIQPSPRN